MPGVSRPLGPSLRAIACRTGRAYPKGLALADQADTEAGRNCSLFVALMKWAGSPFNLELDVLAMARATNDGFEIPLPDQEVSAIAKSVERYRAGWSAQGRVYTEAEREAWGRSLGLASATARRAANARRDFRIIEGHAAGWSQRHLAKLFKMSQTGVWKVLRRHELEAQSQAVIPYYTDSVELRALPNPKKKRGHLTFAFRLSPLTPLVSTGS